MSQIKGGHLSLDFHNVRIFNTLDSKQVEQLIKETLETIDLKITNVLKTEQNQKLHLLFQLSSQGHVGYFSENQGSFSIDSYMRNSENLSNLEINLNDRLNGQNCKTNVLLEVSNINKVSFIDQMPERMSLLYGIKLLIREQTPFQELRIYDTELMGRVLVLDEYINISDQDMEDDYTRELPRHVGYKATDKELEHVLIIGGGDCLIANHLCKRFPNIKKITMCELDKRVVECVMQYFNKFEGWVINENINSGRLQIIYDDGCNFVQKQEDNMYDGIVIDCTDTWTEESPSYVLTTPSFYKQIRRILKPGAAFSQMLSCPTMEQWFAGRWKEAGLSENYEIFPCPTPQYGGFTPFGYVYK